MTWLKHLILFFTLFVLSVIALHPAAEARLTDSASGTERLHNYREIPTDKEAEAERLKTVQRCRESGDVDCMLDHMTAEERTAAFRHQLVQGSARKLRPGENPERFKVRINVKLGNTKNQYLEIQHAGGKERIMVSGGKGGHSNPIRKQCFVPHSSFALVHSAKYKNAPMPNAIFFMGRNGNETGNVFAIHASSQVTGSPASMGCIRTKPADAKKIRGIVDAAGLENTVICID